MYCQQEEKLFKKSIFLFKKATISKDVFNGNSSIKANLTGADLTRANLQHANLPHADLRGAILSQIDFHSADFDGADLRAVFNKTNFYQADNVDFSHAYLDFLNINADGLPCIK